MKMDKKSIIAGAVCLAVGIGIGYGGINLYKGGSEKTYTVTNTDRGTIRVQPSRLAERAVYDKKSSKNLIVDRLVMDSPTVVRCVVRGPGEKVGDVTYNLGDGSSYKLAKEQPTDKDKCNVLVTTNSGKDITLTLPKSRFYPYDEGEWILIRNEKNQEGWVQISSKWDNYKEKL